MGLLLEYANTLKVKMKNIRSFFIVGIMLVMVACLSGCKQDKQEEYETEMIYIYLEDGISKEEINTIETELNSIEGVKKVKYISKKDALQLAKEKFGGLAGIAQQYLFYWKREA